jgi:hypothetical protein
MDLAKTMRRFPPPSFFVFAPVGYGRYDPSNDSVTIISGAARRQLGLSREKPWEDKHVQNLSPGLARPCKRFIRIRIERLRDDAQYGQ